MIVVEILLIVGFWGLGVVLIDLTSKIDKLQKEYARLTNKSETGDIHEIL